MKFSGTCWPQDLTPVVSADWNSPGTALCPVGYVVFFFKLRVLQGPGRNIFCILCTKCTQWTHYDKVAPGRSLHPSCQPVNTFRYLSVWTGYTRWCLNNLFHAVISCIWTEIHLKLGYNFSFLSKLPNTQNTPENHTKEEDAHHSRCLTHKAN